MGELVSLCGRTVSRFLGCEDPPPPSYLYVDVVYVSDCAASTVDGNRRVAAQPAIRQLQDEHEDNTGAACDPVTSLSPIRAASVSEEAQTLAVRLSVRLGNPISSFGAGGPAATAQTVKYESSELVSRKDLWKQLL